MDGNSFLKEVTEKLKDKIEELNTVITEGQKDIESMNDYFWENYAEMDEYGYENYDNQQALLSQVNANQEKVILKHRFEKMLKEPFFGRVDFRFDEEEGAESFYIGISNFSQESGSVPLIYDWRAPVSGLFYDYDKGPASYEAPGGVMEGEIKSKWQYKIRDGKMVYGFESDMKIDDEILQQELGSKGDTQLKNIVRTIQKEQNAIIRNTQDKILVIQGAAGSGKTSVALHRIAYLLYHDRKHLKSSNVLILSPNGVFSDYISHVLPELGEENIQEMSFDIFAYKELKSVVNDCEERYDLIERRLKYFDTGEMQRYKEKQSKEFIGQMESFLAILEDELMDFFDVEFRGIKRTEQQLIELFYFKFQEIPLLARMDAILEHFIDEYETLYNRNVSEEAKEFLEHKFKNMYVTMDLYQIYNQLMKMSGYPELPKRPYEKRSLMYEDVFPMLYLKQRLLGKKKHKYIKHLVIDEMQDYSYLQYAILHDMFSCKMTILGDKAQTIDVERQDVLGFLPEIFGKNIRKIVMNKSYRNTIEIARYAGTITGITDLELFERHGKNVIEKTFVSAEEAIKEALKQLCVQEGEYETAAILTMRESEAKKIYKSLKKEGRQVSYIDRDSARFRKGLTVTTFYMAKGLEFDQVFTIYSGKEDAFIKQAKYICATRALHELYMYEV